MNSWTITGWVNRVERKKTPTGKDRLTFVVASPQPKKPDQEKTNYTYARVKYWGDLDWLQEGQEVMAHGSFYASSYEAKDGTKRYDSGMEAKEVGKLRDGKMGKLHKAEEPPVGLPAGDDSVPF